MSNSIRETIDALNIETLTKVMQRNHLLKVVGGYRNGTTEFIKCVPKEDAPRDRIGGVLKSKVPMSELLYVSVLNECKIVQVEETVQALCEYVFASLVDRRDKTSRSIEVHSDGSVLVNFDF
jgi:chorismate mutase